MEELPSKYQTLANIYWIAGILRTLKRRKWGEEWQRRKKNAIRTSEKQRFPTGFSMTEKKKGTIFCKQNFFQTAIVSDTMTRMLSVLKQRKQVDVIEYIFYIITGLGEGCTPTIGWLHTGRIVTVRSKHNPVSSIWNSEDRRHNIINTYFVDLIKKNFLLCFAVLICCTVLTSSQYVLTSSQYEHSLRQIDTFSLFVNLINYERPLPPLTFLMFICTGSTTFL